MTSHLFLDFDGVLHPVGAPVDRLFCRIGLLEDWLRVHPMVVVVVSSSWRVPHTLDELREFFAEDIRTRILGATGVHWRARLQQGGEVPIGTRHERELEVVEWLRVNRIAPSQPWAALEDEPGLYRAENHRVVYCDRAHGLTPRELRLLEDVLVSGDRSAAACDRMGSQQDILYLDFDGVLHPEGVFVDARRGIHLGDAPGRQLFENAQILVDELKPYSGVKIVLSTSWVRALGYDGARARLPEELSSRCIGATYHSRFHRPGRDEGFRGLVRVPLRGEEVLGDVGRRKPRRWIALDDTNEGWPPTAASNLVLTDPYFGIGAPAVLQLLRSALRRFY